MYKKICEIFILGIYTYTYILYYVYLQQKSNFLMVCSALDTRVPRNPGFTGTTRFTTFRVPVIDWVSDMICILVIYLANRLWLSQKCVHKIRGVTRNFL